MSLGSSEMRILSIFEANSVIGPLRPLLVMAKYARYSATKWLPISHAVATTYRERHFNRRGLADLRSQTEDAGLPLHILWERHRFDPSVLRQLNQLIRQFSPTIIETHNFKSHLLLHLLRLRHGTVKEIPWVAFHHGYTTTSWTVRAYQQFDRFTLRHADHVVTFCRPFMRQLEGVGVQRDHITIIANTFTALPTPDCGELRIRRSALRIHASERVFVCVGRLSSEKGQRNLLLAFRKIGQTRRLSGIRALLVGDGPDAAHLREEFIDLGDQVIFTGHVSDPWIYYCLADCAVLPSLSEGSPLALLEAMSAGLPVVASAVGGIPEVVTDRVDGLLVPPGSTDRLASALLEILDQPNFAARLGAAARESVRHFGPDVYRQRLLEVYAKVSSHSRTQ